MRGHGKSLTLERPNKRAILTIIRNLEPSISTLLIVVVCDLFSGVTKGSKAGDTGWISGYKDKWRDGALG